MTTKQFLNEKEYRLHRFLLCMGVFDLAVFVTNFQFRLRSYNSTMLALTYRNGFTSRALLGTIYHALNHILPVNMIDYTAAFVFSIVATFLCLLGLLWFSKICLARCSETALPYAEGLLFVFSMLFTATFAGGYNFLRVDLFMLMTSLVAVSLLLTEKAEWLVVPLSVVGVMFHQGYVFMYFNIILIFLALKWFAAESAKRKRYYVILFVLAFVLASAFFLYFELFSRNSGEAVYEEVRAEAEALSYHGIYHTTLLAHEVLGIDLNDAEIGLRKVNHLQTPIYLLCMLPYLVIFVRFFVGLFRKAATSLEKWKYLLFLLGAATMLPDYLLKCDYGRWIFATISYYMIVTVLLLAMRDAVVTDVVAGEVSQLKEKPYFAILLLVPVLFLPFRDVDIAEILQIIQDDWIDKYAHWVWEVM